MLNLRFLFDSIRRNGFLKSCELGLSLLGLRLYESFFSSRFGRVVDVLLNVSNRRDDTLYAFYDLAKVANGFVIVNFLVLTEMERRDKGYRSVRIVIVPPLDRQYEKYRGYELMGVTDFYARLQNIVVPSCHLLSSCVGVIVCVSRSEASCVFNDAGSAVFPLGYTVRSPIAYVQPRYIREAVDRGDVVPSISAPPLSKEFASYWLRAVADGRRVVTITLRESTHAPEKNSDIVAWTQFAQLLLDSGVYFPVFIRDTEQIAQEVPALLRDFTICYEASLNVIFRTALYEEAYINLFVNNGPSVLGIFNENVRYIIFKFLNNASKKATKDFLRDNHGIDYLASFPGAKPWQKLVWEDDTFEVVSREFQLVTSLIKEGF